MRFLSKEYPTLRVHGVVKFADGIAEVTDPKHIKALSKLERFGIVPAEPVKEATSGTSTPKRRGRPPGRRTVNGDNGSDNDAAR